MKPEEKHRHRAIHASGVVMQRHAWRVREQLAHALEKHPAPWRGNLHALAVLLEEVFEVVWALVRRDKANLRVELAQVAAVCVRWLERTDRAGDE